MTEALKRTFKVGAYSYWVPEEELPLSLDIGLLVFPLRYDILIRKSFFDFYSDHRGLYQQNPSEFINALSTHPYHTWFQKVLMVRYHSDRVIDEIAIRELFAEKVRAGALLYDSIQQRGFDTQFPIIPFTGESILPATSGRAVTGKFFMGDGCHRLSCLMSMGYQELPRGFFRVRCFRSLSPFDNTALLTGHMDVDWSTYLPARNTGAKP